MHSAPAVSYPVGRSFLCGMALWSPLLLGVAVFLAWAASAPVLGAGQGLMAVLGLAAAFVAQREWRRAPQGRLHWNGQDWQWEAADAAQGGTVAMRMDWQAGMLLEFQSVGGGVRWLWVRRAAQPLQWAALRRAVTMAARPQAKLNGTAA